ncbi:MAG: cyclopropane-fatty-acyl-phospholipid synthase [Proteobacteria bacterium]|nr:cyclopropane-fatty-acyl-phospholipid synthase [Pseudomonadota bacterium]
MKKILQKLLKELSSNIPGISFEVRFWDGEAEMYGNGVPVFVLTFNTKAAAKNILSKGTLGFGEEYTAGNIDVEGDIQQLICLGIDPDFQNMELSLKTRAAVFLHHISSLNTLKKSPGNIAHHYDLGNDFYKQYLDESMTYSCAYFRTDKDTLEQAQQQKYEHICRKLQLKEGETLIDIGCGWGGMLLYAAHHHGVKSVGCTLSRHQTEYARNVVAEEGLENEITILREDYRNIKGQFDKFVSIGMFEHVGKGFIPTFMEKTRSLLKPGGIGLLHTIGKESNTPGDPWTKKYIFPGSYIPALDLVIGAMGRKGIVPIDIESLRLHYAKTLDEWGKRFEVNVQKIEEMFDKRFARMWRMFLNGSAAAFRWGDIRLYQILFTNGLNNSLPMTREYLYGA